MPNKVPGVRVGVRRHTFQLIASGTHPQPHPRPRPGSPASPAPLPPCLHVRPPALPQVQDPAEARPFLPLLMPLLDRLANEAADPELREVRWRWLAVAGGAGGAGGRH